MSSDGNSSNQNNPHHLADADLRLCHVFIRDLVLPCSIGIHEFERDSPQRVRINLDLAVREPEEDIGDEYQNVVCYEKITNEVRDLVTHGHVNLVETLAENLAAICLKNPRVHSVRVRVEKPDIIEDAASVGVEIERKNKPGS